MSVSLKTSQSRLIRILLREINLNAVKKIIVSFDPFSKDALSARQFVYGMTTKRVRETNPACKVTASVRSDRSKPEVDVQFGDGHKALFMTQHLSMVDITKVFKDLCVAHSPQQVISSSPLGSLDTSKKKGKKR